jgi:hypothetical protein
VEVGKSELTHCRGSNTDAAVLGSITNNATTLLVPIGGGKGAGTFWSDYFKLQGKKQVNSQKKKQDKLQKKKQADSIINEDRPLIEQSIFQLLRPSLALRSAMEEAIKTAASNNDNRTAVQANHYQRHARDSTIRKYRLMALHPRVEQEMIDVM